MLLSLMSSILIPLVISLTISSLSVSSSSPGLITMEVKDFPFRNTSLPWDKRVDDLVSRLTLSEIQLQMARGGAGDKGGPAPAISRLGIGPYQWDTECLTGDAQAPGVATGFPTSIGMAASFE
ncbi:beta-D-xylosidase 1 [Elysia marginata]|uniref:Beta-D-xylosidase 1 n=1 Tax=Elysia marginata TaxID=1093978 RepID=A0AAV4G649_9GAST|nr:beta-D-xylosidase 1 [Elysia marginata]